MRFSVIVLIALLGAVYSVPYSRGLKKKMLDIRAEKREGVSAVSFLSYYSNVKQKEFVDFDISLISGV